MILGCCFFAILLDLDFFGNRVSPDFILIIVPGNSNKHIISKYIKNINNIQNHNPTPFLIGSEINVHGNVVPLKNIQSTPKKWFIQIDGIENKPTIHIARHASSILVNLYCFVVNVNKAQKINTL
ncbi:MAG: hypothetical protein MJ233_01120 [Mycoplasmoidaceae bacterium]|nr:hypothetical protein [Mycoplasmoidaceae bacterium]